uniref:CSON002517 protein n=1 Tax=Culicoides sonorensis TaxID=179676 RepID=A0A336K6W8_CULSO
MDLNKSKNNRSYKSSQTGIKNVVINLSKPFITATQGGLILNGILDHVLFFSGQIPNVFPVFKQRINQALKGQENQSNNSWTYHQQTRHLEAAKQTMDQIIEIKDNVIQEFRKTEISEAVIALGSTIFTVKQAFVIRLPSVDTNHFCVNHERANISLVMNLMRSLSMTDEMTKSFDLGSKSTKVFLLLRKPLQSSISMKKDQNEFFTSMSGFQLPSKCKTTCMEIVLQSTSIIENTESCCKLMKVCSDISNISLTDGSFNEIENFNNLNQVKYDWFISTIPIKGLKQNESAI